MVRKTLDGILASPFPGRGFVPAAVGLVDVRDFRNEWVVGVWVGEHGTDREQDCKSPVSMFLSVWARIEAPLEIVKAGDH
jgi:hypothetical protein